jgi:DNA-directed RNA polymerase
MDMMERELELEQEMLTAGVQRYYDRLTVRGVETSGPGLRITGVMTEALAKAIEATLEAATGKRQGRRAAIIGKLAGINPGTMALLTVRCTMQALGDSRGLAQTAHLIGTMVAEHDDWTQLTSKAPGLAYTVRQNLKKTNHEEHRRKVTRHVVAKFSESAWTEEERAKAGMWLLELLLAHTNLAKRTVSYSKGKRKTYLEATPETERALIEGHLRCEKLSPVFTPMVCPPQPWTDPFNGGYLQRRMPFIKIRDHKYIAGLDEHDLSGVFNALNTLQEVPYRINKAVLRVLRDAVDNNDRLPGMVDQEQLPLPAKPVDIETNEEARTQWKREAAKVHSANATVRGERIAQRLKLNTAEDYQLYDRIYFPHTLDWRGRAYPVPVFLNPQGDDMAKSLLQFADGKELGEEGLLWLKVHVANLFGVDKVGFGDRIAWVDEMMPRLIECGTDPMTYDFWTTADKPWQALAACFELVGVAIQGESYVSHLPVAMDGSCNGLQHLSAMLKDETGGASVNLVPADKPADIYTRVAEKVEARLAKHESHKDILWESMGVSRKLVKRPVMTTPYGVTGFGIRDQLKGEIVAQQLVRGKEEAWLEKETDKPEKAVFYAATFIAPLVKEAISETVLASQQVMDWLRECALVAGREANVQLSWVNPVGLPAQSHYWKMDGKKYRAQIGAVYVQTYLSKPTDKLDVQKQATGMSPNVVHSFDAAHMMLTVNACAAEGITALAMVHDSYATHACDVGMMNALLRQEFIGMYEGDVLNELYHQFMDQLPADVELPYPPTPGNLDLSQVADSLYFFA